MRRRTFQIGFAARLVFAIAVTFVLAGAAGYGLMSRQIERRIMAAHVNEQHADAKSFAAIGRREGSRAERIENIDEVLHAIHRRPGVLETLLIDEQGIVRAAGGDDVVGEVDRDSRIDGALEHGIKYAGREADTERDTRDLEFVIPVSVAGHRYAYEMSLDHASLDDELRVARDGLIQVGLLMLLLGGLAFYVAGGRVAPAQPPHGAAPGDPRRAHRTAEPARVPPGPDLGGRGGVSPGSRARPDAARRGRLQVPQRPPRPRLRRRRSYAGSPPCCSDGRAGDTCYRIGGDEFAMLLPHTDAHGARSVAGGA